MSRVHAGRSQSGAALTPTLVASTMSTPIGPLSVVARDGVVVAGGFTDDVDALTSRLPADIRAAPPEPMDDIPHVTDALRAYFDGDVTALDRIVVEQRGGPFQQQVWAALRAISPGQPTTYRMFAAQLGGQQLARAVGLGCATNLIAPIVPCHRVAGSDGSLRGYYWGLERKRWLLDHEARHAHR